jgi:L-fuconolactonase
MTRIDAHQHFWRYSAAEYGWIDEPMAALRRDFLPEEAAREMAASGVDACVAVQARQSLDETKWLLSLAEVHPQIAGVVGWVDLQSPDVWADLDRVAAHPKLVGVRHIVQAEPDDRFLMGPPFRRGIAQLEAFGFAYDLLIYPRQLAVASEFVSLFERQRLVLDHLAKPDIRGGERSVWARDLRRLADHPNVWAKLSGLVTEADWHHWTPEQIRPYLDVAFDCFGASRLMIGSDWPVCTVAADYARTMSLVTDYVAALSSAEREAVLGGNAQKFWNLKFAKEDRESQNIPRSAGL